jgi:GT2 family glycosyltransferase
VAKETQAAWLLLLDQDTILSRSFLMELLNAVENEQSGSGLICAFVPKLVMGDLVLSPNVVGRVAYRPVAPEFSGFSDRPLVAFNSASCLNIRALEEVGGFPKEYWLDYLDHIVFHRLQAAGGQVYVLDSRLEHNLSLKSIESEVSLERYSNILAAEWRYVRETGAVGGPFAHRLRLLKRGLIYAVKLNNKSYAFLTLRSAMG